MQTIVKSFDKLSREELYQLLALRSEVFVVEQDCAYQDVDGKDKEALHLMVFEGSVLAAYARIFPPGAYFNKASVGRVVVKSTYRGRALGVALMKAAMHTAKERFNTAEISLSAQTYLKKFYTDLGFQAVGAEYLEDGIPHILMEKTT